MNIKFVIHSRTTSGKQCDKITKAMALINEIIYNFGAEKYFNNINFPITISAHQFADSYTLAVTHWGVNEFTPDITHQDVKLNISVSSAVIKSPMSILIRVLLHELLHCDQIARGDLVMLSTGICIYEGRVNELYKLPTDASIPRQSGSKPHSSMQYEHDVEQILHHVFKYTAWHDLYETVAVAINHYFMFKSKIANIGALKFIAFDNRENMIKCIDYLREHQVR